MEFAILDWIQAHLRCGFLDAVLPAISWTSNHGEIWILLTVLLLLFRRTRRQGATVALALYTLKKGRWVKNITIA